MKRMIVASVFAAVALPGLAETRATFSSAVPLVEAVRTADLDAVESELAAGADVRAVDGLGRTSLHYAAAMGLDDILERLLSETIDVNAADNEGVTPLMRAAQNGHMTSVRQLLREGADRALRDARGRTAHAFAVDPDILALLAED